LGFIRANQEIGVPRQQSSIRPVHHRPETGLPTKVSGGVYSLDWDFSAF
jgi:hypothetical protein